MRKVVNSALKEYSVLNTTRATNMMSQKFRTAYNDITTDLCDVYNAKTCAIIPGAGSMGMESSARAFGSDNHVVVLQHGNFSYRWSQIMNSSSIPKSLEVLKATIHPETMEVHPVDLDLAINTILEQKPKMVCLPHVETSVGLLVRDSYIAKLAEATHKVGGLLCLDGIASGTLWIDMQKLGVDIYLTAPQKGWGAPACSGIVMLGERAYERLYREDYTNAHKCWSLDLKEWLSVTDAYAAGGFKVHTTSPSDSLMIFRDCIKETMACGLGETKQAAWDLGTRFRDLLEENGFKSTAANTEHSHKSPVVCVSWVNEDMQHRFAAQGIQITPKSPMWLGEPDDFQTFRVGLFGLDKLFNQDKWIEDFRDALKTL